MNSLAVPHDPRVLVGIATSDDAGVFRLEGSDELLIQTADFITPLCDDPRWFGRVAAANSFSDIYAMGGRPLTALNLCCFPHRGLSREVLAEILQGGLEVIVEAGAALVGGQSVKDPELKYGLAVTGLAKQDELTPNAGARAGDALILTKPIGTGVLIGGYRDGSVSEAELMPAVHRMAELNSASAIAMRAHGCKGATDITGFGLVGHAWEMAAASKVQLTFYADAMPYIPAALTALKRREGAGKLTFEPKMPADKLKFADKVSPIHRALFCDPQTSGGLLIAIAEPKAQALLKDLHNRGVTDAAIVGHAKAGTPQLIVRQTHG
jgi:selenide,water dikinase